MSESQPIREIDGSSFPSSIMASGSRRSMPNRSSVSSNGSTHAANSPAVESGSLFVSAWWSSTGDAFGSTVLRLEEDRPSAFPFQPSPESEVQSNSDESAVRHLPVLLVEDNGTDVFVIRRVLQECGLDGNVRVATDGQEALHYLESLDEDGSPAPALVLLDLNVPKIPGLDVLRHMRTGKCRDTPVIIVTSSVSEGDRFAAKSLGVEAYFQKPNDLSAYMELASVIKRILVPDDGG